MRNTVTVENLELCFRFLSVQNPKFYLNFFLVPRLSYIQSLLTHYTLSAHLSNSFHPFSHTISVSSQIVKKYLFFNVFRIFLIVLLMLINHRIKKLFGYIVRIKTEIFMDQIQNYLSICT